MVKQKKVIDKAVKRGLRVKAMVGGAPVTREQAQKIEADAYSEDAIGAIAEAKKLVER